MAIKPVLWLPDALRAEGCTVKVYDGWRTRGRPASTGGFDAFAALWHHTGTHTSASRPAPTLRTIIQGRPDLPGPLAAALIGYDGVVHVVAAGRANHAGRARATGPVPAGDGNEMYVGFEIDYDGRQDMGPQQYDAAIRAGTAVVRHYDHSANYCRGHKETSVTGKWDPGGISLDRMRLDVAIMLRGHNTTGDDDMPEYVSLSGPGMTLKPGGDWLPVKFDKESSDSGGVHAEDYAWLNFDNARYSGQLRLNSVTSGTRGASVVVRWAEYQKVSGEFVSAPGAEEHALTSGESGINDMIIDTCASGNRVRAEVKARGAEVVIGGVGMSALYWPR